ncbi:alpha/beta hydrolase family protein [Tunturiibacter gelidiferens]|uniref:alpha/beta hydrolase family protein n=1 Tax=Tunturiibacter gelidiferens TaxID=3069689 RepID=UPI003D9BB6C0
MRVLRSAAALAVVLTVIVGVRAGFAATTYEVGASSRVFTPAHVRNWRRAKTEALVTTIWYPVNADGKVYEEPQVIGPPDGPLFLAGGAAVDAPIASAPAKFPVVMLSHGTGGSAMQLAWLGTVLARHGYIAVGLNHPGNNALEPYTAEGFVLWWERATDISDALDALLLDPTFGPHVDEARIGAAGFSIGGYTVLELAGARTDQERFLKACETDPTLHKCVVPEMKGMGDPEQMLKKVRASSAESMARGGASYRDPRVRAVFAIAPAVGQAFDADGFRDVTIPVAMVVGAADQIAPVATNAGRFLALIPNAHLAVLPGGVAHYTFLDACTDVGRAKLGVFCGDAAGVDREKVHGTVSEMAVKFFDRNLK